MKLINRMVYLRRWKIAREILALYCVEIPKQVVIGKDFDLVHRGFGTVIHPSTVIGDRVRIYHQVTIGRSDAYLPGKMSKMGRVVVEDDVVLFPGAKILGGAGDTTIGNGTVIGANSVLLGSTGEWEIWAGIPARKVGDRKRPAPG